MGGRSDGKSQFRSHDLSNRCGIRRRPPSGGTANYAGSVDWEAHAARGAARYEDGAGRLPDDPRRRERQLVRMAMAATSVGLAREMQDLDGSEWFHRSAAAYRESFAGDNWGRVVGAVKAGILAGDARRRRRVGARAAPRGRPRPRATERRWRGSRSARTTCRPLASDPEFPGDVAAALDALAARDAAAYRAAAASVLASFESRQEFLDDLPVADTVLVLELLAAAARDRGRTFAPRCSLDEQAGHVHDREPGEEAARRT